MTKLDKTILIKERDSIVVKSSLSWESKNFFYIIWKRSWRNNNQNDILSLDFVLVSNILISSWIIFCLRKWKSHHKVRQNNLSVASYDDLWIGDGSLRKHDKCGAGMQSKFFVLFKERPKIRASHVSPVKSLDHLLLYVSLSRNLLPLN